MSKSQINLQDAFLNQLRKESIPVTLYLTSGVQLRGQVRGFDAFTVILEGQGKPPQLVYKHSIVSVAPMRAPSAILGLPGAAEEGGEEGEERAPSAGAERAPSAGAERAPSAGAERAPSAGAELAASVEAPRG